MRNRPTCDVTCRSKRHTCTYICAHSYYNCLMYIFTYLHIYIHVYLHAHVHVVVTSHVHVDVTCWRVCHVALVVADVKCCLHIHKFYYMSTDFCVQLRRTLTCINLTVVGKFMYVHVLAHLSVKEHTCTCLSTFTCRCRCYVGRHVHVRSRVVLHLSLLTSLSDYIYVDKKHCLNLHGRL